MKRWRRLEPRSVKRVIDLVSRFCEAGELVLHHRVGSLASAKACSQLPEHYRLAGSGKYSSCSQNRLPSLLEVYAKQDFSPDFEITGSEKFGEKCTLFVKSIAASMTRMKGF